MAISGNLSVAATLASYHHNPSPSSTLSSKVDFTCFMNGRSSFSGITLKWTGMTMNGRNIHDQTKGLAGILGGYKISPNTGSQEVESILLNAINMSFFERLNLAWKIVFPSPATRKISDEAKRKIVKNIVRTPSDFVEMESKDKVQLSVSIDSDLGSIYSVTVPVQRVRQNIKK
ncbi:hypothetical protein Golax_010515 [Gossypium laxum]|uniref:Uncharacterized protein n=1 Tax=Gossypium laxum TaxID=34288 RepID=A0A7J8ZJ48_9ROSI|nr:hypothetical protein [Gossypium laxum]